MSASIGAGQANFGEAAPGIYFASKGAIGLAPGPSILKPLHRPYLRKATVQAVEAAAPRDALGRPIDPNTGRPIVGKVNIGHKYGREFWREKAKAEAEGLTQAEFNDRMNNPDLYQLEDPLSNQSYKYEMPR